MSLKFNGTFGQLHGLMANAGVQGTWEPEPNGVFMLRCTNGANMHWASGSKRVWFDGPVEAQRQLALQLQTNLLTEQ